jgi:hypothetical protein
MSNASKMISPAEIAEGMFITVLENLPHTHPAEGFLGMPIPDAEGGVATITHEDRSGYGEVLKVEAIQLPYVLVSYPFDNILRDHVTKYDTRRTTFMELNEKYVAAMKPK